MAKKKRNRSEIDMASRKDWDDCLQALYFETEEDAKNAPVCKTWWKSTWLDDVIVSRLHDRFCTNCRYHNRVKANHLKFLRLALGDELDV